MKAINYGSFTLVTFVSKTVGVSDTWQEIETILSVSRCPRWPRQVQWWLSHVTVIGIITGVIALHYANVNTALGMSMDKIGLTGQNLGRVFNSRSGCFHIMKKCCHQAKLSTLRLKTRTEQVLGLLLLYIVFWLRPKFWRMFFCSINKSFE